MLRNRLLLVFASLLLVAAACGGSDSGDGDGDVAAEVAAGDSTDNEEAVASDGDADDADESNDGADDDRDNDDDDELPVVDDDAEAGEALGELIGIPIGDEEEMEAYFLELQREAEAKVAVCMAGQGFEYTPQDFTQFADLADIDRESREYAETYGFGVATNEFQDFSENFDDFRDPNEEYVASLSEGEREAYQQALMGEMDFSDPASFEPGGCQGEAFNETFTVFTVFEEFEDEFLALEEQADADPRMVEARDEWSRCMADQGYSAADTEDLVDDFSDRFDAIVSQPGAFEEEDFQPPSSDDDDGEVIMFGMPSLNPEAQAEVDALAAEEVAAALASWDCGETLRETERIVNLDVERQFIEQNGDAIRELLGDG